MSLTSHYTIVKPKMHDANIEMLKKYSQDIIILKSKGHENMCYTFQQDTKSINNWKILLSAGANILADKLLSKVNLKNTMVVHWRTITHFNQEYRESLIQCVNTLSVRSTFKHILFYSDLAPQYHEFDHVQNQTLRFQAYENILHKTGWNRGDHLTESVSADESFVPLINTELLSQVQIFMTCFEPLSKWCSECAGVSKFVDNIISRRAHAGRKTYIL